MKGPIKMPSLQGPLLLSSLLAEGMYSWAKLMIPHCQEGQPHSLPVTTHWQLFSEPVQLAVLVRQGFLCLRENEFAAALVNVILLAMGIMFNVCLKCHERQQHMIQGKDRCQVMCKIVTWKDFWEAIGLQQEHSESWAGLPTLVQSWPKALLLLPLFSFLCSGKA